MTTTFYKDLAKLPKNPPQSSVLTIGTFDGIHLGHQAILSRVRERATEQSLRPILVTFHPHPRVVVSPDNYPMLLTSMEEKEQFIPDFFNGDVIVLEFNRELRNLSAEEFVKDILVGHLGVKHIVVGFNHSLGKDRQGNSDHLRELGKKMGFELEVVEPVMYEDSPISSTRIRKALIDGSFTEAVTMLGHEYAISGTVQRGISLGRKIGFPTANLQYSHRKLLPPQGVYACWTQIKKQDYCGMVFIGKNHFNPADQISVEVNIFDFEDDIYDQEIVVYPVKFIRENRKFPSIDKLIEQIHNDKRQVIEILRKGTKTCH